MRGVKPLPEAVRSSIRSGVVLYDLARVVEELVFNSLDAGARKVSVFVGVGTCYVKVVDDGCGITRDGLVLLGERYATSKSGQFTETDAASGSFGSRGEALASISDVSLLEVVTKASGRPNGYRKVMKGSKCLYLGVDDDRKDVGTTVVVRDLFYNQPVRRKCMQSSPKKVLHSVKKCVHRIALVHSKVSFKIVDVESEDELLRTIPSPSPLTLLKSTFGIEVANALHKLNISDGKLELSGYISTPCNGRAIKAFQYVYINSRFICKGPIHKLLNQLASSFECWDPGTAGCESHDRKRSRPQAFPAYVLNLSCPQSFYDLNFEPSKTYVEFKDWVPVLTFIDRAIQSFWKEKISYVTAERGNHPWMSDINFSSDEEYAMESRSTAAKRFTNVEDNIFSSAWRDQPFKLHPSVSNGSAGSGISHDHHEISSDVEVTCDLRQPFLNSCSSRGRLASERDLFAESEIKFQNDGFGSKRMRDCSYNTVDVLEIDCSRKRMQGGSYDSVEVPDFLSRTMWPGEVSSAQPFPRVLSKVDPLVEFDPLSKVFFNSMPTCVEHFDGANLDRSEEDIGSCDQTLNTEWCSVTSNPLSLNAYLDFEPLSNKNSVEGHYKSDNRATERDFVDGEEFDCSVGLDIIPNTLEYCTTHMDCGLDSNDYAGSRKFLHQDNVDREFCAGRPDMLADETDWLRWHSRGKDNIGIEMHNRQKDQLKNKDFLKSHVSIGRSIRSHSAPPFHRGKRKYFILSHPLTTAEASKMKDLRQLPSGCHQTMKQTSVEDLLLDARYEESQYINTGATKMQKCEMFEQSKRSKITAPNKEFISKTTQDSLNCKTKWRNCCPQITSTSKMQGVQDQNDILDISSGFLHLAADSLVPTSIDKNCLKDCRVLQQVDKKFIPVMAGRTLAVIDQHAADERIRLEELRQKVLSGDGEAKTVTFLDIEQELMLPEIGYQLLHNYAKPIKEWGWRCNIHAQGSESFKRNLNILHRQPTVITLVAVPCILGVNLSDVDLMEFLQQLSDTDGSSTIPPSVLRILNSKACRGAIMFGDSLLPSECSLIVEELKQTSLCFQCAHGRPTTAPLVNLEALHKQIAKISSLNKNNGADHVWHGLYRHELSLARAEQRLNSARS